MNPNRMANHRRGEKAKLLSAVDELCERLARPVCSGDLRVFFRAHPERRPCLLKRLGQQLIVAAEVQDDVVPYLKRIGIFRHKAYYAPEETVAWRLRFLDHRAEERIAEVLRLNIPDHILTLEEGGEMELAVHASAGLLTEIDRLALTHTDPAHALALAGPHLRAVRADKPWRSFTVSSSTFVDRAEVTRFLTTEAHARRLWDVPLSPYRHLVRFRWPQTLLFPTPLVYAALHAQLFHFVRGKWPVGNEDDAKHRAMAECLRYGAPTTQPNLYLAR